ncbi:hypothetical protein SCARR_04470 [Pontiella sulfatireligans]|uniref:Dinitrogenase iron-molybdenum cofactor biosynthesis domain-containing protein n=1 Tax=Pontiella sulfatireligans TaxID=2750658 RepID=A0A6C2UT45_9BACT|nr:hypothetical protein SCARR_04470 [Pontiella sulfatireligans]
MFDVAGTVVLMDADGGMNTSNLGGPADSPQSRIAFLEDHQVDVLICGAISRPLIQQAEAHGIQVQAFVSGEIHDVLEAFKSNQLDQPGFSMPGCRRCQRRQGRCH